MGFYRRTRPGERILKIMARIEQDGRKGTVGDKALQFKGICEKSRGLLAIFDHMPRESRAKGMKRWHGMGSASSSRLMPQISSIIRLAYIRADCAEKRGLEAMTQGRNGKQSALPISYSAMPMPFRLTLTNFPGDTQTLSDRNKDTNTKRKAKHA